MFRHRRSVEGTTEPTGMELKGMKLLRLSLLLLTAMLQITAAKAQDEPEYRAEVGAGAGMQAYQGDYGGSISKMMQPCFGAVGKYKFNPRMAVALTIYHGKVKGELKNISTWYPHSEEIAPEFSTTLTDVNVMFEYNFFPYGTGREYRGAKPLTPFIMLGPGMVMAKTPGKSVVAGSLAIGLGAKYKVAPRLNITLDWAMHFTLSDKLDGLQDPYDIKSSGIFKNTDCYAALRASITYDLWAKCRTCHKE